MFSLISCQRYTDVEVIIENNTEHQIQIEAFHEGEKLEVLDIEPYDNYIVAQKFHPEDSHIYLFQDSPVDSVNIIFDSVKIIVQSCLENDLGLCPEVYRNILSFGLNYEYYELARLESQYLYFITEEDYDRAIPIN
jgi:hypothetical protein